ncbi:MAG TPA: amidohydrolase family protein [Candidatus Binatia bacterium]|jgi:imidazolonepropionase-like amidohydrolase|nr:amidohydrolase family protein [Candidatus Binatia bacterium]
MRSRIAPAALLHILLLFSLPEVMAQSRPVVIQGGTLIDGTGRSPVTDAIVVFQDGRIRDVGRRSDVKTPEGAEVIDATGKTILPGLIDGHCHLRDWMGELYLHFGITTCPTISNNPTDWVIAQRDGVKNGTIRAQRVWAAGNVIDGPPPEGMGGLRRQRMSVFVTNEDEARAAVRAAVAKGVDGFKLFERLRPQDMKAAADEAHRADKPVIGHSLDIYASAAAGYQSVEHAWSVLFTSITDPKKKHELDMARITGKISTAEALYYMEKDQFDKIIKVMVERNVHWSPTWGTTYRPIAKRGAKMREEEAALLKNPDLRYLPSYIPKDVENLYSLFAKASPELRQRLEGGYKNVQEFARRFVAAGGKIHLGSDPDAILAGYGVHAELEMAVEAGLTPVQAIEGVSLNVAEAWGRQRDYGSVEKGKVADIVIVNGDVAKDITATMKVEKFFMDGKPVDTSFHPDYKNPIPRPIVDRPEQEK